jgi:hypothetical protein
VIDSEKAGGYSPLDFLPLGRFVLGFLETERERGSRSVCRISVEGRRGPAEDPNAQGRIRENHGDETSGGKKSMRKVRTER